MRDDGHEAVQMVSIGVTENKKIEVDGWPWSVQSVLPGQEAKRAGLPRRQ
jgi:hypothetical protein